MGAAIMKPHEMGTTELVAWVRKSRDSGHYKSAGQRKRRALAIVAARYPHHAAEVKRRFKMALAAANSNIGEQEWAMI